MWQDHRKQYAFAHELVKERGCTAPHSEEGLRGETRSWTGHRLGSLHAGKTFGVPPLAPGRLIDIYHSPHIDKNCMQDWGLGQAYIPYAGSLLLLSIIRNLFGEGGCRGGLRRNGAGKEQSSNGKTACLLKSESGRPWIERFRVMELG